MARPKSFDVDEVLEQAATLFWNQGYEATSMRDLENELGVGRQSLYDTFGDKRSLFLKALERYAKDGESFWAGMEGPDAGLAELRTWFDALVDHAGRDGRRAGCFVVNTVAELGDQDEGANAICRRSRETLAKRFRNVLENAVRRDELPSPADLGAAADFLVAQTYGVLLMGKNGAARDRLRAATAQALRAVGVGSGLKTCS
ncbi:MAG: TetR/AcrR family transcriptional regulator [Myxococcota bacterium]